MIFADLSIIFILFVADKGLLEKMNALETYPPYNQKEAAEMSASPEYAHVKGYSRGRTCGTLSKSEWEASCKFASISIDPIKVFFFNFIFPFSSALPSVCLPEN